MPWFLKSYDISLAAFFLGLQPPNKKGSHRKRYEPEVRF
jgi:hypothetical protein